MCNMQLINSCAGAVRIHLDIATELASYIAKKVLSNSAKCRIMIESAA